MTSHDGSVQAIGAVLSAADDLEGAARNVHLYLIEPTKDHRRRLEESGIPAAALDDFRPILPTDFGEVAEACSRGRTWAAARRESHGLTRSWEPVVTGQALDPPLLRRGTAETLIMLATEARESIELFAPFADKAGFRTIGGALAGATRRGALVTLAHRQTPDDSSSALHAVIRAKGDLARFRRIEVPSGESYPHLKLMIADRRRAYVGSANLTRAALLYNLELGVLVSGTGVEAVSRVFELLIEPA